MNCADCGAFDEAERSAIEGRAMPAHGLACARAREAEIDVLYVPPDRFRRSPQVGVACSVTWRGLTLYLERPTIAETKEAAGAWSPARYRGNVRRKGSLMHVCALVVDVDEGGDVARVASALVNYRAVVHSTFSSSSDAPRCRIVLALAEPVDGATYEQTHAVVRAHLQAAGIVADEGAKDASRLSYAPVVRAGSEYHYRTTDGAGVDVGAVLAAQPRALPSACFHTLRRDHPDAYVRAALRRASSAVTAAPVGARHVTLNREAYALARLDVEEEVVAGVLLPAFVCSVGEEGRREGERTIRDAFRARRGGA